MTTNHQFPTRTALVLLPALLTLLRAWLRKVAADCRPDLGASRFTVLIERRIG